MSSNPFETALNSLRKACEIAGVEPIVERFLSKPKRVFEFTIPLRMDNGEIRIFDAYRVHFNDALGPIKDGTRLVPNLDLDTVKALGLWMTIKHAVAGIPAGGGKGGIRVDLNELSDWEYDRLIRAFIRKLPLKGAWVDIPGADIGTSGKTQAWMLDEYEEINGFHCPAAINDKPAEVGGTAGSKEATGTGAFYVTLEAITNLGIARGASAAIQGFGTAGSVIATLLYNEGFKVIAVSDIQGGIARSDGINVKELKKYAELTGSVVNFPGTIPMTNQELLEAECDILVPAAVQSVITGENASNVKAGLIVEVANGPVTPEGEDILERKGVTIIPDVIANCGSAIACSFERIQGLTDDYWELDKVLQKLDERIIKAYRQAVSTSNEKNVSLRTAAWVNAVNRVAGAMKMRGWV